MFQFYRLSIPAFTLAILAALLLSACRPVRSGRYGDYLVYPLDSLNTAGDEYGPVLSPDGLRLYFVSNRPGGVGGHDFWYATRRTPTDTVFSSPVNMGPSINTPESEGGITLAADGMTIFFAACNRPGGAGECDIYSARLNGTEVTDVRNIAEINTPNWEGQPSVTGDGRTLYFASSRAGVGGEQPDIDIYSATLGSDGRWSAPANLGATINSKAAESSPSISRDGTRLYFASTRLGGYGRNDFYVAARTASGWSEPQPLGVPFSTAWDDRTISFTPSGTVAFLASSSASAGKNLNLYMVTHFPAGDAAPQTK